ncbi:hypothetical protein [Halobaculum sp. D14]|uniref:hypothetical protein n=1 Tax=Halobaculum sp. D14 TaxID=3421642 RepID=UPI003EBBCAA6
MSSDELGDVVSQLVGIVEQHVGGGEGRFVAETAVIDAAKQAGVPHAAVMIGLDAAVEQGRLERHDTPVETQLSLPSDDDGMTTAELAAKIDAANEDYPASGSSEGGE